MDKPLIWLVGVALLGWISGWSYLLPRQMDAPPTEEPFILSAGEFVVASEKPFAFDWSSAELQLEPETAEALAALALHLTKHPELHLRLTGLYTSSERNGTSFPTLGEARAAAIADLLKKGGVPAERLQIAGFRMDSSPFHDGKLLNGVLFTFFEHPVEEEKQPQSPDDPGAVAFRPAGGDHHTALLSFSEGKANFTLQDQASLKALSDLRWHLRAHPGLEVELSAFYPETDAGARKLAQRRVETVRRYLIDKGIRRRNIHVKMVPVAPDAPEAGRIRAETRE